MPSGLGGIIICLSILQVYAMTWNSFVHSSKTETHDRETRKVFAWRIVFIAHDFYISTLDCLTPQFDSLLDKFIHFITHKYPRHGRS